MKFNLMCKSMCRRFAAIASIAALGAIASDARGAQILVADRLSNSVYRYNDDGTFLGLVVSDQLNLNQPTGIAVSPDLSKLYVSSFQSDRVVQYDYNPWTGTATNPTTFADASDGLAAPNALLFSHNSDRLYVSNLGGSGVAQFHFDGTSAGPSLQATFGGGAYFQFSGLELAPNGELLVSAFQDFPGGQKGAVGKSNAANTSIDSFVAPATSLNGASGLLAHGNDLYVSAMFNGTIQRFNLTSGAVDPSFGISGLSFPQALLAAPDGNGFLAGILGFADGAGNISRYGYDGSFLGTFASAADGHFTEATAFTSIVVRLAGDTNGDSHVDFTDLNTLLTSYGLPGTFAEGDFDGTGTVDFNDLNILLTNYGQSAPQSASAIAVPEPGTLVFALAGVALFVLSRRAHRA